MILSLLAGIVGPAVQAGASPCPVSVNPCDQQAFTTCCCPDGVPVTAPASPLTAVAAVSSAQHVAVWVGLIALAGVDAETGVVMLLYLDHAFDRARRAGRMNTRGDLDAAIEEGAAKRIRPKAMTVLAILMGLLPIMWSHGTGADVMKRIGAPMVGGVITSFALELLIYPVVFSIWKQRRVVN